MKILVPIKRVIDYNVKARVKADNTDVDLANVKMAINPFCEIAVEQAIRLKEAGIATEVIAVSIGNSAVQEQLRTALALGVDSAIHVDTEAKLESIHVAKLLAEIFKQQQPELIILGKQSIDADNNQTGQMLAALTGCGLATFASKVEFVGEQLQVTREVDGGLQTLRLKLPAVITTDLRLNEPRYASLPNIMKAKRKPLHTIAAQSLNVDLSPRTELVKVTQPEPRKAGVLVNDVAELVAKLKTEAKVI